MPAPAILTLRHWRDWLARSVVNRVAAAAMTLTMLVAVGIGATSFAAVYYLIRDSIRTSVASQADMVAQKLSSELNVILKDSADLSVQPLIVSGLVDTLGRETYLVPFILEHRTPAEMPVDIVLTDFRGMLLVSNRPLDLASLREWPGTPEALASARPQARILRGPGGNLLFILQPVIFAPTGRVAGLIAARLNLGDLLSARLKALPENYHAELHAAATVLDNDAHQASADHRPDDAITVTRALALAPPLDGLGLSVRVHKESSLAFAPLRWAVYAYLAVALGTLALVIVVARRLADRLIAPLRALSETAGAIALNGVAETVAPVIGLDEVGQLGTAFNTMLEKLRESSERLEFLLKTTPAIIYAIKAGGDYATTFISTNVRAQLGYSPEDFTGDPGFWRRKVHPEDLDRVLAELQGAFETGANTREYRFHHHDGSWRWVRDAATLVRDASGRPSELVGYWINVTARKDAEDALRESAARYERAVNGANDGIWEWIPSTGEDYLSPRWKQLLGYEDHELPNVQESFFDQVHPDDRARVSEAVRGHLEERKPFEVELRLRCKSGEYRWFFARGLAEWDQQGRPLRMAGSISDITAHKQAEEALHESEERFKVLFEHAPQADVMVDTEGAIVLVNAQAEKTLGYRREELIGRGVETLVPERFRAEHLRLRAGFARAPAVWPMGSRRYLFARRKDGSELPVEIGLSPVETGGRSFVLVSIVDITDLRRAQRVIEEALRVRTEFMNNVTHELRTPLNSVIGFAELLADEVPGPLNEKQAGFVADIHASGLRLLKLVQGILEMSRLDAGGVEIEREPVDIDAALEERVAAQRKAAEARRVSIRLEVAADAGSVQLDPGALHRILDALLDNAVKFNRDGGRVALRARRDGDWLEIAVADTGIGIAREDLPKLFKPLVQLDAGLARKSGGIGLGLALARRLAELHGGTIEVQSEPGEGSTFTLRLPLWEKKQ